MPPAKAVFLYTFLTTVSLVSVSGHFPNTDLTAQFTIYLRSALNFYLSSTFSLKNIYKKKRLRLSKISRYDKILIGEWKYHSKYSVVLSFNVIFCRIRIKIFWRFGSKVDFRISIILRSGKNPMS